MIQHFEDKISIFWGSKKQSFFLKETIIHQEKSFQLISSVFNADDIAVLKQVHSINGYNIEDISEKERFFGSEGDFLVTNTINKGISVVTADCIPLVLYHGEKHIVSVVHIGWRGALNGIVQNVMNSIDSLDVEKVKVFIGPAARACCYEVQKDFIDGFNLSLWSDCFFVRQNKIYYDNSLFIYKTLKSLGILESNIYTDYNVCTICNISYCSYRRDKKSAGRNITAVILH